MEIFFNRNLLSYIVESAHNAIEQTDNIEFASEEAVIIIGTNASAKQRKALEQLIAKHSKKNTWIIGQSKMLESVKDSLADDNLILWDTTYSLQMCKVIDVITSGKQLLSIVFYSADIFDSRNSNIIEIGEALRKKRSASLYGYDTDNTWYKFISPERFLAAFRVYKSINEFLEVS